MYKVEQFHTEKKHLHVPLPRWKTEMQAIRFIHVTKILNNNQWYKNDTVIIPLMVPCRFNLLCDDDDDDDDDDGLQSSRLWFVLMDCKQGETLIVPYLIGQGPW